MNKLFTNLKKEVVDEFKKLKLDASAESGKILNNSEMFEFLVDFYSKRKDQKDPF